jgi:outer membrane protein assembly factor BamB
MVTDGFTFAEDWPQFRQGASRLGWNSGEITLGVSNVAGRLVDVGGLPTEEAKEDGVISSGFEVWLEGAAGLVPAWPEPMPLDAPAGGSSPAVVTVSDHPDVGVAVFVAAGDQLYGFKSAGGPFGSWPRPTGDPPPTSSATSPAVGDGAVFVSCGDERVCSWTVLGDARPGWPKSTNGLVCGSPAISDHVVYAPTRLGYLHAWGTDGSRVAGTWPVHTHRGSWVSTPAVAENVVYAAINRDGSNDTKTPATFEVYAWSADGTGLEDGWPKVVPNGFSGDALSAPAVIEGGLFVASSSSQDKGVGTLRGWRWPVNGLGESEAWHQLLAPVGYTTGGMVASSSAAIYGERIFVGSLDGTLRAFKLDGTVLWTTGSWGAIHSSPAVANGVVYVGSDDGALYAVRASDGEVLWSWYLGDPVMSSPAVAGGRVYVATGGPNSTSGALWAFEPRPKPATLRHVS